MRIIRNFAACPAAAKGAVLGLGNFDGVHLGHQAILAHCTDFARTEKRPAAAMTFEPHPREYFANIKWRSGLSGNAISTSSSGGAQPALLNAAGPHFVRPPAPEPIRLYPFREKVRLLRQAGLDYLFVAHFNQKFASMSADSFMQDVLCGQLGVRHVITGYNFAFGKGRGGDTKALSATANARGFGFTAIHAVQDAAGDTVSSSAIREALSKGDVARASQMLGRPYRICGHVRHGRKQGRTIGFPTANISLRNLFRPRFGVYAIRAEFDNGELCDGVANIGVKPTVGGSEPLLEAHFFDMKCDCYGELLSVELVTFLRDEQKFSGIDALKEQIQQDAAQARKALA